jgi:peptidase C13-like protein
MKATLRDLARNLAGGALLVFGQPVNRLRFRVGVPQLLALFAASALFDIGVDAFRRDPSAMFSLAGLVGEAFFGALLMLFSAVLSMAFRQPGYALALPVIVLSGEWPLQVVRMVVGLGVRTELLSPLAGVRAEQVLLAWTLFWLWRSAAVSLAPSRPSYGLRSAVAAVLLASPLWFGPLLIQDEGWWQMPPQEPTADARYLSPASEAVLAAQPGLLDDALDDLEDSRPDVTDLYFVGFAPYASEDVFRKDMEVARTLFDDRFDTKGRSIVLLNNPRTVLERPLATVSNLRTTLDEIGGAIDPDKDVVMLYLESHGSRDHQLVAEFPPLQLDSLTPEALRKMLDDAGIKWRIIVVSACYSGGFIDALKDENTLIMTASAADRTSFGCGSESDATYFGDALFQHALRFEDSFVRAFEQAKQGIAAREKKQNVSPPSDPQMNVGSEMAAKLPKLEGELRMRRRGSSV